LKNDGAALGNRSWRQSRFSNDPITKLPNYKITKLQNQGFNATTNAVTTKFAIATGNKNFHPKAINWS
jgi:hypothetical protein